MTFIILFLTLGDSKSPKSLHFETWKFWNFLLGKISPIKKRLTDICYVSPSPPKHFSRAALHIERSMALYPETHDRHIGISEVTYLLTSKLFLIQKWVKSYKSYIYFKHRKCLPLVTNLQGPSCLSHISIQCLILLMPRMLLQAQQMICTLHIKTSIQSSLLWFLIKF